MIFEGAFITPELQTILDSAGGVLLYQEQVMQVMQQYSDFDDETADTARSAMGKKMADKMKTLKKKFVEGAVAKGHPEKDALIIWQDLEKYSEYSFNRSHSLSYALISYQTAWLKTYYPAFFYAETINTKLDSAEGREYTIQRVLTEARQNNITLVYPDINLSSYECKVVNNQIILGLGCIKGLGEKFVVQLEAERNNNGYFKPDLPALCDRLWSPRIQVDKIKVLIQSGALDSFKFTRKSMLHLVDIIGENRVKLRNKLRLKQEKNRPDANYYKEMHDSEKLIEMEEFSISELATQEKDIFGLNLRNYSSIDLSKIPSEYNISLQDLEFRELDNGDPVHLYLQVRVAKEITTKQGKLMAFLKGEDINGEDIELVCFTNQYHKLRGYLKPEGIPLIVLGKKDKDKIILESFIVI